MACGMPPAGSHGQRTLAGPSSSRSLYIETITASW